MTAPPARKAAYRAPARWYARALWMYDVAMLETPNPPSSSSVSVLVSADEPYAAEMDAGWLAEVARAALIAGGAPAPAQVSLHITGDDTVRALNAQYRGLDETTDVLSFSAAHPGHWEGEGAGPPASAAAADFILPPDAPPPLGEIIVSWPQAQRQAAGSGIGPRRELAALVIHGALHLLGYDHEQPQDAARMQARESHALNSLPSTEFSPL